MRYTFKGIFLLIVFVLFGCEGAQPKGDIYVIPSVYDYRLLVEEKIGPQLIDEFTRKAWFKETSFIILSYRDGAPTWEIDGLTAKLRQEIEAYMRRYPRIKLKKLHPPEMRDRPHRSALLECSGRGTNFDVLLGIELKRASDNDFLFLLKAESTKGVQSPFSVTGRFIATDDEVDEFLVLKKDDYIAGTKFNPFFNEKEKAANFLAYNLGCIAKWFRPIERTGLYIVDKGLNSYERDLLDMMKILLKSYYPAVFVGERKYANIVLKAESFSDGEIHIVRLTGDNISNIDVFYKRNLHIPCIETDKWKMINSENALMGFLKLLQKRGAPFIEFYDYNGMYYGDSEAEIEILDLKRSKYKVKFIYENPPGRAVKDSFLRFCSEIDIDCSKKRGGGLLRVSPDGQNCLSTKINVTILPMFQN